MTGSEFSTLEQFTDEEYITTLESITTFFLLKHYRGILQMSREDWDAVVGPYVGGSLHISFDEDHLILTVTRGKDAKV